LDHILDAVETDATVDPGRDGAKVRTTSQMPYIRASGNSRQRADRLRLHGPAPISSSPAGNT